MELQLGVPTESELIISNHKLCICFIFFPNENGKSFHQAVMQNNNIEISSDEKGITIAMTNFSGIIQIVQRISERPEEGLGHQIKNLNIKEPADDTAFFKMSAHAKDVKLPSSPNLLESEADTSDEESGKTGTFPEMKAPKTESKIKFYDDDDYDDDFEFSQAHGY
jgi:hypothetical protein